MLESEGKLGNFLIFAHTLHDHYLHFMPVRRSAGRICQEQEEEGAVLAVGEWDFGDCS